jgi:hypothetical protein
MIIPVKLVFTMLAIPLAVEVAITYTVETIAPSHRNAVVSNTSTSKASKPSVYSPQ